MTRRDSTWHQATLSPRAGSFLRPRGEPHGAGWATPGMRCLFGYAAQYVGKGEQGRPGRCRPADGHLSAPQVLLTLSGLEEARTDTCRHQCPRRVEWVLRIDVKRLDQAVELVRQVIRQELCELLRRLEAPPLIPLVGRRGFEPRTFGSKVNLSTTPLEGPSRKRQKTKGLGSAQK
jgi:hypothetical protein